MDTTLKEELCRNTGYKVASRLLPSFVREAQTKVEPVQEVKPIALVPVAINVDGVDMKFDAIMVLEGHFPQVMYLDRQELKCFNIGVRDVP